MNTLTRRVQSHHRQAEDVLLSYAESQANAASRAIGSIWQKILTILSTVRNPDEARRRIRVQLERVGPSTGYHLRKAFVNLWWQGRERAAEAIVRSLPRRLQESVQVYTPPVNLTLWEDTGIPVVTSWVDLLEPLRDEDLLDEMDSEDIADYFQRLLFRPPPRDKVAAMIDRFVRPFDTQALGDREKRMPAELANAIANGYSQGETQQQLAMRLLPYVDGSRVRAKRAARTFGLVAAHNGQQSCHDQLGALIIGYQVFCVHPIDRNVRPEHRKRDGFKFFYNAKEGQRPMSDCPAPPLESDGTVAFNCRCYRAPLLRI